MNISLFALIIYVSCITILFAQKTTDCTLACNDLKLEVLSLTICREAKRTLPKPKVGDFCSVAMEQGFTDACTSLCQDIRPMSRVASVCRAAAMEMPRPTVRKWCEHGYLTAFDKTLSDLKTHFVSSNDATSMHDASSADVMMDPMMTHDASVRDTSAIDHHISSPPVADDHHDHHMIINKDLNDMQMDNVRLSVDITLDDRHEYLIVYEGQEPEDAVALFCRQHLADDLSGCIRQLLPDVLDRLADA